jgi:hypothetical protein
MPTIATNDLRRVITALGPDLRLKSSILPHLTAGYSKSDRYSKSEMPDAARTQIQSPDPVADAALLMRLRAQLERRNSA